MQNIRFLDGLGLSRWLRKSTMQAIKELWAHGSTAIEGNSLTLGDTQLVLREGLTISGKPLKDHVEVVGHAKASDLLFDMLGREVGTEDLFRLHKAVMTEEVLDVMAPCGAWKVEANGTQVDLGSLYGEPEPRWEFLSYAAQEHVPVLMDEFLKDLNDAGRMPLDISSAPAAYARAHLGFANVHPFCDGNGRMARLLSNIPLLNGGLPPLVFHSDDRAAYLRAAVRYTHAIGTVKPPRGLWPKDGDPVEFEAICEHGYRHVQQIIQAALDCQAKDGASKGASPAASAGA